MGNDGATLSCRFKLANEPMVLERRIKPTEVAMLRESDSASLPTLPLLGDAEAGCGRVSRLSSRDSAGLLAGECSVDLVDCVCMGDGDEDGSLMGLLGFGLALGRGPAIGLKGMPP
eukprot:TRINITY_DN6007_c0_g1_i3.p2 TRINITY_DN6007_c0_g1~~TRINITY_DN6007_c0_g1_i3.p2  ORF type:complete len:116 (-),score=24.96 TRINITY_DN6007_c0_g1_i3:148-495(-)